MELKTISDQLSVASEQLKLTDLPTIHSAGFRSIICNRPDGEAPDQPSFEEIRIAAEALGMQAVYIPIERGMVSDADAEAFGRALRELPGPKVGYCRTGTRSTTLWALASATTLTPSEILATAKAAGYDVAGVVRRIVNGGRTPTNDGDASHDIVIVGGGAAGIAVASSLLSRNSSLDIAVIDPAEAHYYQPGWTLVGAGVFDASETVRTMAAVLPSAVRWIKSAVAAFEPEQDAVILEGCRVVKYKWLVVCPGLKLDWQAVEGLPETLGRNGVTSNYRYDLAPYTWQLVQGLESGRAVFTQPPMPIKCAGAPQKAMYLSADHWLDSGRLKDIAVEFRTATPGLFGVKEYVPALMEYIKRYDVALNFKCNLVAVDGQAKKAWFDQAVDDATPQRVEVEFDFLHVCPPQCAPDFIRVSPLADAAGWVEVDQATLRHQRFDNVFSLGDVMNAPNAKTAAAARKQAPVVAENLMTARASLKSMAHYDGYGSCPLTVERGRIVLAEFGYGGKLLPSFPKWLNDGTRPTRLAWFLKERLLPPIYWNAMLKGREWLARPDKSQVEEVSATAP